MVVGMLLAGLAFVVAGFVQLKLQSVNESLKSDESKLVMYNNAPFPVDYRIESLSEAQNMSGTVKSGEVSISMSLNILYQKNISYFVELCIFSDRKWNV